MSAICGVNSSLITSVDVNSISLSTCTIITGSTGNLGTGGGYQLMFSHDNTDCSNSRGYLELKDNISWSKIAYDMIMYGYASCWGFNDAGYSNGGNLLTYNESLGDMVYNCLNSWEKIQFQTYNKQSACDNQSDNFFHGSFATGDPKVFRMIRRRNINGSLAGIAHGRACNGYGTTLITNIRIW